MGTRGIWAVVAVVLGATSGPARAWKPITHVHLAQEAWEDAKDGKVTLHRVDYESGAIGEPLGEFEVSDELLAAIRRFPASYFAGVLGPDAYPDMVTGQMRVHPPGRGAKGDPDLNEHGPGTEPWLRKLWLLAFTHEASPQVQAFVAGYLAHAAGDVFAHTYVNSYTGGIFDLTTANGVKHTILEGYLEQRTPALRPIVDSRSSARDPFAVVAAVGIASGVDGFIARTTAELDCPTCAREEARLLSLPWNFVQLRDWMDTAIAEYERTEARLRGPLGDWIEVLEDARARMEWACDLTRNAECPIDGGTRDRCPGLDNRRASVFWCPLEAGAFATLTTASAPVEPALAAWRTFTTTVGPAIHVARGWQRNIDTGLVRWVTTSHRVAQHLFFNARGMDMGAALAELRAFAPVAAAMATGIDVRVITRIQDALKLATAPIRELERLAHDLYEDAFRALIGISPSELQEKYVSSHAFVDAMFGPGTLLRANRSMRLPESADDDLRRFPREPITRFDWRRFPAAYNTVTLIKLSLLKASEVNRLYRVLAGPAGKLPRLLRTTAPPDNVMLGWGHTIDGSNQWMLGMPLAEHGCVLFQRLFQRVHPGPAMRDRGSLHPAEPKDECRATLPTLAADTAYASLLARSTRRLGFSEDAILEVSAGSITPCKGTPCEATYTAPDTAGELDVLVTARPKVGDRPAAQVWIHVRPALALRVAAPGATALHGELAGAGAPLWPGQRVMLEVSPRTSVAWTLEGPGQLLDAKDPQRRVYVAGAKGRATIRVVAADGRTAAIEFALRARAMMPLRLANPSPTVQAGQVVRLEVVPPVPIAWTIEAGGKGQIGEPGSPERKKLEQELAPLRDRLRTVSLARPDLDRYIRDDVAKRAVPLGELAKLTNTYRAPASIAAPATVVVTGVAQDGTGRRLSARIQIVPRR